MSSDPIEVLRRVADELRRADALANKSDKIDRLKVIGRAANNNLSVILSALASLSAPQPPAEAQRCTCPSGDGSLRWPCPVHPPSAPVQLEAISDEEIAEWERERGNGMVSAVGEYTPDEFWLVLDELKRLRALAQQPAAVSEEAINWLRERRETVAGFFPESTWLPHMDEILRALAAQQPAADSRICRVCDGGPGNDGSCLCGHRKWEQPAAVDEVEDVATGVRKVALAMKKRSLDGATRSALLYSDDLRVYANCLLSLVAQQGGSDNG